jgi:hypothetical protein
MTPTGLRGGTFAGEELVGVAHYEVLADATKAEGFRRWRISP